MSRSVRAALGLFLAVSLMQVPSMRSKPVDALTANAQRPDVAAGTQRVVEPLPAGVSLAPAPGAIPVAEIPKGFEPTSSKEVIDRRDRFDTVYQNADGSQTLEISSQPVHYQVADGWEDIDSSLVATADGFVNRANEWKITFPASLGEGISFDDPDGHFGWRAVNAADVKGVVGDDGVSIRYADAWLDADLVYRVNPGGIEELVELKSSRAAASYQFSLIGADAVTAKDGSVELVSGKLHLALDEPVALDADGRFVDATAALSLSAVDLAANSALTIGVDEKWLASQPVDQFPITIDPSFTVTPNTQTMYPKPGQGYTAISGLATGNPGISGKPAMIWRSVGNFNYWSGTNNILGKRVSAATLTLTTSNGSGSGAQGLKVFWADVLGYHDTQTPRTLPPPYPYGHSWSGYFGSGTLNAVGTTASMSLTSLYDYWTSNGLVGGSLLFKGDNEPTNGTYTYKEFTASLSVTYNDPPSAPALTGAANPADATDWWALPAYMQIVPSTDPEGATLSYRAEFSRTSDFSDGVLMSSNWQTYNSSSTPVGPLVLTGAVDPSIFDPGQDYYWRLAVTDGWYVIPSASVRKLTWDPDPEVAPTHDVGPWSVNAATGTYTTSVSSPSFQTVGGPISASLTYTNNPEPLYGLNMTVVKDADADGVVDPTERTVTSHRVGTLDKNWGTKGETTDTWDNFIATWTGQIQAPATNWQIGLECDQRAKVWINGAVVLDQWTSADCSAVLNSGAIDWAAGTLPTLAAQSIVVQLRETTGAAKATLWTRQSGGTATKVPSSWLTTRDRLLPVGWELSAGPAAMAFVRASVNDGALTLQGPDGTFDTWHRSAGAGSSSEGWIPEAGGDGFASQGDSGTIVVHEGGMTYLFNSSGDLQQMVTSTDDKNRSSAAVYSYDGSGRPLKTADPVSGRQLRYIYQGQTGCGTTTIPAGALCAIQFALSNSDASPETWTSLSYSSSSATATLTEVKNYPDPSNPNQLDKNQTWQFGYSSGPGDFTGWMNSLRDPTAVDAIRSGAWTGTQADASWTMSFTGTYPTYWAWPYQITSPAPTVGASKQVFTITNVSSKDQTGFTDVKTAVAGTTPPAGYQQRYLLDNTARPSTTYDNAGRASTIAWDANDRVYKTIDPLGQQMRTLFDKSGNPVEQWGPVPASNTACLSNLDTRDPATPFASVCNSVPVVETDYDYDTATNAEYTGLDATWWANTNLAPTTSEPRPAMNTLGIGGAGGSVNQDWGSGGPAGLVDSSGAPVTDNFSVELTGVIVFGSSTPYTMKVLANDGASVWIDDKLVIEDSQPNVAKTGTFTPVAGVRYRIRITMVETVLNASLQLFWAAPGATPVIPDNTIVPGSALHPDFGYATRVRTFTTADAPADVQTFALPTPQYGQPATATAQGLSTSYTYEPSGTGWGRQLSRTLPAGNSWTYTYYGDTATLAASTCGVASGTVQSGLMRQRLGPDPDGSGPGKRRIEEFIYDRYGNQRGSRVGSEGSTTNELDATVPWTCVATVDGMNRPLSITYPASSSDPARTVLYDYAKNGNSLVGEICDNNIAGSPPATTDTCSGKNGVITTTVDLLGRTTAYTDVWGQTTTNAFDQAGRATSVVDAGGTKSFDYTSESQLWHQYLNGATQATLTYNTNGELQTVSYANGTHLADLDAAGRRYTDRSIKDLTFVGPYGTITSNTITSRDRNGRVLSETIDGKEYRYSYDTADRLVRTQFGATGFTTPDYDWQFCYENAAPSLGAAPSCTSADVASVGANGNRTAAYVNGAKTATYAYDNADRLTSVGVQSPYAGQTITYDQRGNTTSIGGEGLTYDGADRHMMTAKGSVQVTYQRDALDRIVSRSSPDGVQRYVYDDENDSPSAALNDVNSLIEVITTMPSGVLLTQTATADTWSYPSLNGSLVAAATAGGTKIGATSYYDPYGSPVSPGQIPDNGVGLMDYGYVGQYQRPTEHTAGIRPQAEMGVRGYDPQLGRFLSVDPVEGGNVDDYAYPLDPRSMVDLDGRIAAGFCASVSGTIGWWFLSATITFQGCLIFAIDDSHNNHASSILVGSIGFGVGAGLAGVSAAAGFMISSSKVADDFTGLSGCVSGTAAHRTVSGCAYKGKDGNWYSSMMVGGSTGSGSANVSGFLGWKIKGWMAKPIKKLLQKLAGCKLNSYAAVKQCGHLA